MRTRLVSWLSFILCFCWMFLSLNIYAASSQCLRDQQSLLLQLKNSLNFNESSSIKLVSWDQRRSCCDWSGVACDEQGRVIGLDLSAESIFGGFDSSSSIFSLQYLKLLNLASNNFSSVIPREFYKLKNLNYLNLSYAGFVGQIPKGISQLTGLVTLDISSLSYYLTGKELKLENPNLRMLTQNLTSIRKLYLDGVTISAQGREWGNALSSLSSLQELSVSNCNLSGPIDFSLSRLKLLSVIRLDENNLSATVPDFFGNFSNLTRLHLSSCGLSGRFPLSVFLVKTLTFIDISYNTGLSGSFPNFPLNGSLQTLIVSHTNFSGRLPDSISNLRNLSTLDLSNSQFSGRLPSSISKLTELTYLDLSLNSFIGPIPSFGTAKKLTYMDLSDNFLSGEISSSGGFEGLQNLASIKLRNNSINGSIPTSLFALPSLRIILLSNNKFSQLDEFFNVSSSVLNTLDLSSNNLSGPVPKSIFQLKGLSILQLSSNKFSGPMLLDVITELRNLTTLDLSYNNLSVNMNASDSNMSSVFNMTNLKLAYCNLETFPDFLRRQSRLTMLDLSDNRIRGRIPNWIWQLESLTYLNLSHNLLTDIERPLQNLSSKLVLLDLHYNKLQGPITIFPKYAAYLDYSSNNFSSIIPADISDNLAFTIFLSLSNNAFQGSIPNFCNFSSLQVLDLSLNHFSGTIPSCLMAMSDTLAILTLRKNNLTGVVPDKFPALCALRTLDLNGNQLDGPMPKSLANCGTLEVLDLGNNHIMDGFPCSLKNISTLRVLVFRNNCFHGSIGCPNTNDTWQTLQIVDLAFNNFSGELRGKSLTTWEGMMPEKAQTLQYEILKYDDIYYQDRVIVTSKGQQMKWFKILTVFTAVDLSSNHLEGPIPEEMMNFEALYILNLSNNALTGQIPSSIGNLRKLESLDLSNNSLSGKIPIQIASLSFLSFLNLSLNQLAGMIPLGTQIQSFDASSFGGNKGLCGPPLTPNCTSPKVNARNAVAEFDWEFVFTGVGFGVGAGSVVAPLMFWERARKWSNNRIHKILLVIFPMVGLTYKPSDDYYDEEEEEAEENSDEIEDCDDYEYEDELGIPRFRGRYCVFCSRLDISRKKAIHNPRCTCHHSPAVSTFSVSWASPSSQSHLR
ncbi:receptor-like protein 7 [Prosopis cineraria]|uniref:receptor-like protein 7 n=1 Tax=Prosopis cineraria TaxID=364024 RepID=UPI00240F20B8|nr:receptor-like protein 7 [Prosopis cineraria]